MNYYLIGKNIETSLSPRIHNYLFKLKGSKSKYQLHTENTPFTLHQMQHTSFGGTSITIPFKKNYANLAQIEMQGVLANKLGVINTIYKDPSSRLIGVNTDIFGVSQCFRNKLNSIQYPNALLIGAGATAQIFCHFFQSKQYSINILNRSSSRMQELQQRFTNVSHLFSLKPDSASNQTSQLYSVIVNTLPSEAVYQNWNDIQLHLKLIFKNYPKTNRTKIIYMNVNYRHKLDPIQQLIKSNLSLFAQSIKGIDMLLWQAIQQNRYFCNQPQYNQEQYEWQMAKLKKQLHLD